MFGIKKSKAKSHHSPRVHFDTLISGKTKIEGDLQFSGGLHIDGLIRGTIRAEEDSDAIVRISDVGEIDGDVIAPHIIVNGTVHGDVYASKHIELAQNASVKGNVYYHMIEMAMGAEVNGNLVHHKEAITIGQQNSGDTAPAESSEQVSLKAIPAINTVNVTKGAATTGNSTSSSIAK